MCTKIHVDAMKRFVASRWNLTPHIHIANSGVFVFQFQSEEEMLGGLGVVCG